VLIGTTSECREKVAGWYERIALAGERDGNAGLVRAIYGESSTKQIIGDAQGIATMTRMLKSLHSDPLTPKLGGIQCPALLTVGEKDPMGPKASEIVHGAMPAGRAELLRIPDKGHWLQLEAVEPVISALDGWLDKFEL
jgi:pimeloyl-ACP methyl ester carboxylesterase